ncbi:carboxylate--amine ligase [Halobacterium wangiae]|uniref:carboxylate--amine ligase n=1 Tax=Halobacterium wangiae TaxID=2902623 RepID=UPI001E6179B5|nr:carboxylate--amine ligase [Halobacterium wangiae]
MSGSPGEQESALIPSHRGASGYACVRSLAEHGVDTIVVSEKDGVPAAASRFCTESGSLPPPREDLLAYRDALLEYAAREDVRTVVPARPEDTYVLSRYYDEFDAEVSIPVPEIEQLRSVYDRLELADVARAASVPAPETRLLSSVGGWDGDLVVKSRFNVLADVYEDSLGPADVDVAKDIYHVSADQTFDAAAIEESMGHDPIVQEFIPKDGEFMFAALYDRGEPLATFQHRQIRGSSYRGGGGVYRESIYDPELESVARDLLDELEWHGLACIEYMRDARTGQYVLTEINPRMWQSLPSTVHAGADFPYYYWLLATGRADEIDHDYETGVGTHLLYGELAYLLSILREESPHVERPSVSRTTWNILASCITEPSFDYLSLDDYGPFLTGLKRKLSK